MIPWRVHYWHARYLAGQYLIPHQMLAVQMAFYPGGCASCGGRRS